MGGCSVLNYEQDLFSSLPRGIKGLHGEIEDAFRPVLDLESFAEKLIEEA